MSSQVSASEACSTRVIELLGRLSAIQRSPKRCIQPVGIIGPGDGGTRECEAAYRIASLLGRAGMAVVSGGRGGVMEAASRGAFEAGGVTIGILPEEDTRCANRYLSVAIPTGIGEMRNALIARSSICLVAIGGGMGTISEMALGLKWEKTVFSLYEDIQLPGVQTARDIDQLLEWVAAWLVCRDA
ncbi:TIGR00725 family protein [Polaromonas sp. JS666]|uniref:TIGR00725 family protein n=1 Tax=Polaromonas sp. (strain JS666 / ATCC BAA-500) TaxID=296591 RepID=UPI00059C46DC|nr:TIGR00725 family protein [Polaromonas sp. JS666]